MTIYISNNDKTFFLVKALALLSMKYSLDLRFVDEEALQSYIDNPNTMVIIALYLKSDIDFLNYYMIDGISKIMYDYDLKEYNKKFLKINSEYFLQLTAGLKIDDLITILKLLLKSK